MPDDAWEVEAGVVRPYLFTNGRTRPTTDLLAVETMLAATDKGGEVASDLAHERRHIVELCREAPLSVAEVASRLSTPLGVVRVLVADLADEELIEVVDRRPNLAADVELLQRLIARVKAIPTRGAPRSRRPEP